MKAITVTKARQDLYNLIQDSVINSEPVQITSKKGNVILVSLEDWEALQETLYINSIGGLKESLVELDNTPLDEWTSEEDVRW